MKALETDSHFKTTDIDCRDTTCVATLEWESRKAAEEEFGKVVSSHKYEANCEKGLSLPEPVPGETTVKVPLLLNCEGWKQAGSLAFRPNE